jgi:hypothetical protein
MAGTLGVFEISFKCEFKNKKGLKQPFCQSFERLSLKRWRRTVAIAEIDRAAWHDGGDGVFVNHLRHGIAQQHHVLIKRFNLSLELDAVDQVNGDWHMLAAQYVEERVLQQLAFVLRIFSVHDILRVSDMSKS